MQIKKTITTRELLRNFKSCKEMLTLRKVESFLIPIEGGEHLTLGLQEKRSTGKSIAEAIRRLPRPIHIKRYPHLFNDLIRRKR